MFNFKVDFNYLHPIRSRMGWDFSSVAWSHKSNPIPF